MLTMLWIHVSHCMEPLGEQRPVTPLPSRAFSWARAEGAGGWVPIDPARETPKGQEVIWGQKVRTGGAEAGERWMGAPGVKGYAEHQGVQGEIQGSWGATRILGIINTFWRM